MMTKSFHDLSGGELDLVIAALRPLLDKAADKDKVLGSIPLETLENAAFNLLNDGIMRLTCDETYSWIGIQIRPICVEAGKEPTAGEGWHDVMRLDILGSEPH